MSGTKMHPPLLLCALCVPFHVFQPPSQVEGDPLGQQELWSHKKKKKQAVAAETSAVASVL